ncbi:MAG TPA: hypothetical protein PKY56_02245 [Candidatus Kapabacteria bacterium]|nr:hypothetical protein [Candidatus Kapabacteria bacterium]HPO62728.1 hypothetical protein [Candidatus Kapabacteria bacterium]
MKIKLLFCFFVLFSYIIFTSCSSSNEPSNDNNKCKITETLDDGTIVSEDKDDWKSIEFDDFNLQITPAYPNPTKNIINFSFQPSVNCLISVSLAFEHKISDEGNSKIINDTTKLIENAYFEGNRINYYQYTFRGLDSNYAFSSSCFRLLFTAKYHYKDSLNNSQVFEATTYGDVKYLIE